MPFETIISCVGSDMIRGQSFGFTLWDVFVWIIILLLIVGLAGFGISQSGAGGGATAVAGVGDKDVTVNEYVRAVNLESQRISQQVGRQFSIDQMRAFGIDQQVLTQLLNSAAIDNEAEKLGISVGDETIRTSLLSNRAFQGPDGNFDETSYEFALQNAGMTPSEYDQVLREETTRELFRQGVVRGIRLEDTAATEIMKFLGQRRSIEWVRLDASHLDVPVGTPSDAELTTFHGENEADYTLPETRLITYAYVTEDLLLNDVTVTDASLQELFEERSLEFNAPARRIADRIVFGSTEDAQAAIDGITSGAQSFSDVAQARGLLPEDMDQGEVTEADLNDAARALLFGTEELGVYGPVDTNLGPAIYRINAVLDATNITLADVRDELRRELAREEAAALIQDEMDAIDDLIAGGATIEDVARETFMELGAIALTAQTDDGLAADQAFREEGFTAAEGEDRDLTSLSDGIFVLRVDEIKDPTLQPLEDVRADVEAAWVLSETTSRLTDLGGSLKERIDGGEALGEIASELNMTVIEEAPLGRNDIVEDTPPEFVRDLFTAEQDEGVVVGDEGSVLVAKITDIIPAVLVGEEVGAQLGLIETQIENATANDLFTYFTQGLQDEAGISVNQSLIESVLGQLSTGYGGGAGHSM